MNYGGNIQIPHKPKLLSGRSCVRIASRVDKKDGFISSFLSTLNSDENVFCVRADLRTDVSPDSEQIEPSVA